MASSDPMIQSALADPSNIGFVKGLLGLSDMVIPGEDSRNKQLREIDLLLAGAPIVVAPASAGDRAGDEAAGRAHSDGNRPESGAGSPSGADTHRLKPVPLEPSVPVDLLFDNHVVELEECRRWANSDAGQVARIENPLGFANVRAHAEAHLRAIGLAYVAQNAGPAPKPGGAAGSAVPS
jgi:hypothetical protein